MDVTVLPFRPFFSLLMRMIPSSWMLPWDFDFFLLQEQFLNGFPHLGQIRQDSVEYTKRELSDIDYYPQLLKQEKIKI
jgi:hypothetical protein